MPSFFFRRKFCSRRRCRRPSVFKRKQKAMVQIDHLPQEIVEMVVSFLPMKDAPHIDNWVTLAASMRMKRLVIDLSGLSRERKIAPGKYALPLQLLDDIGTIKHLRTLQLSNLSLKPLGDFRGFVNLTMLELQLVDVAEGDLESLLCKCPALERLALNACGPFMSLRIGHELSRLEHLCLGDGTLVEKLQIEAMNLRTNFTQLQRRRNNS